MSLYHMSNKLNELSSRRYSQGRKDIPKILNNYHRLTLPFGIMWTRGAVTINGYLIKRLLTFSNMVPAYFHVEEMPGAKARSQFWVDPRVEFGLQNRRRRR